MPAVVHTDAGMDGDNENSRRTLMLDKRQIRELRAQAQKLKPELQIGKDGFNDAVLNKIRESFNTKELLKVKMLDTCPESRQEVTEMFSMLEDITLVQNIGHTWVLYKKLEEKTNTGDGRFKKEKKPDDPRKKSIIRRKSTQAKRKLFRPAKKIKDRFERPESPKRGEKKPQ